MEASKISFTPETQQAINQVISKAKRKQLRRESVLAYVDSKPAGTPIKNSALIAAAGIKSEGSGWVFIQKMVDEGFLIKTPAEGQKRINSWAVGRRDTYVSEEEVKRKLTRGEVAIKERRTKFLDFIDSKPTGTAIRTFEFSPILGITSTGSIANYINKQVELGYISKEPADGFKSIYCYAVLKRDEPKVEPTPEPETPADAQEAVSQPESEKVDEPTVATNPNPQTASTHVETAHGLDWFDVEMKARRFSWEFNSDSLREFIKWSKN